MLHGPQTGPGPVRQTLHGENDADDVDDDDNTNTPTGHAPNTRAISVIANLIWALVGRSFIMHTRGDGGRVGQVGAMLLVYVCAWVAFGAQTHSHKHNRYRERACMRIPNDLCINVGVVVVCSGVEWRVEARLREVMRFRVFRSHRSRARSARARSMFSKWTQFMRNIRTLMHTAHCVDTL